MIQFYRLDENHNPLPCTLEEYAAQYDGKDAYDARRVADDTIAGVRVSTVFLAIDHGWRGGVPILFETMIFGGVHDEFQRRYCTWPEAMAGHNDAVLMVLKSSLKTLTNQS